MVASPRRRIEPPLSGLSEGPSATWQIPRRHEGARAPSGLLVWTNRLCLVLVLGILEDQRLPPRANPHHVGLSIITAAGLILGAVAFAYAWSWAGRTGPVNRLTSRAFGIAMGYLVPSAIALHALCFHWASTLQSGFTNGLLVLFSLIWGAKTG
jgi:hypothetical protein